ncbi:MAG: hypothetical protein RIG82_08510 [Phycisphaeraceae bacterium]
MPLLSLRTGKLCIATLFVFACNTGCISHNDDLVRIQNEIRTAGEPLTFEDLNAFSALPEGAENAAQIYQQAFDAWVKDEALENRMLTTGWHYVTDVPGLGEPLSGDLLTAARDYTNLNRRTIDLLVKASQQPHFRIPVDYTRAEPTDVVVLAWLANLKRSTRLITEQAYVYIAEHQAERAADMVLTIFRFADHTQQTPEILCLLYGNGFDANAYELLDELRAITPLSSQSLGRLTSAIHADSEPEGFTRAMLAERVLINEILSGNTQVFSDYIKLPSVPDPNKTRHHANALTAATKFIDDNSRMNTPAYTLSKERTSIDPDPYDWSEDDLMFLNYNALQQARAKRRATLTALAADRYRLDHNTFPTALGQLTPDYLDAIPEDPFNPGHLLKLTTAPHGITIYSIGPDQADDGGLKDLDIVSRSFTTPGIKQPVPQP